jgi:hypothetical protein
VLSARAADSCPRVDSPRCHGPPLDAGLRMATCRGEGRRRTDSDAIPERQNLRARPSATTSAIGNLVPPDHVTDASWQMAPVATPPTREVKPLTTRRNGQGSAPA